MQMLPCKLQMIKETRVTISWLQRVPWVLPVSTLDRQMWTHIFHDRNSNEKQPS